MLPSPVSSSTTLARIGLSLPPNLDRQQVKWNLSHRKTGCLLGALTLTLVISSCSKSPLSVAGPETKSVVALETPDAIRSDFLPGISSMALLITDPDSHWQDLWAAFRTAGIPTSLESNVDEALRHRSIFVYPHISGRVL